jgi:CelD/BcsL family acetyltransferase involved in cellulose biosynthesis
MRVHVISPFELSESDRQKWLDLHQSDQRYASPHFHPNFTLAIARTRGKTKIALFESDGRTVGFFPFRQNTFGIGEAITGLGGFDSTFCGACGPIIEQTFAQNILQSVYQSGLYKWDFYCLPIDQIPVDLAELPKAESTIIKRPGDIEFSVTNRAVIDLSNGVEGYYKRRHELGSTYIKQLARKERKLSREVGEVRFITNLVDQHYLEELYRWKSLQCKQKGWTDRFAEGSWYLSLARELLETSSPGLTARLSALFAGEKMVALTFEICSREVVFWCIAAFTPDEELARYSPGGILMLKLIEHAANAQFCQLDMGVYVTPFKESLGTDLLPYATGCVCKPQLQGLRQSKRKIRELLPWISTLKSRLSSRNPD